MASTSRVLRAAWAVALTIVASAASAAAQDANASAADIISAYTAIDSILPNAAVGERRFAEEPCDDPSNEDQFDFIVVGAGAAGCVVANRLTEFSHWRVLLLEAGGDETFAMGVPFVSAAGPATNWNYTLATQEHGGCPSGPDGHCSYSRGFVMGGSTTINSMISIRGNRRDYDNWAALGNTGWDYDSVLPYFRKLENMQIPELRDSPYHGKKGNIMVSRPYETIFTNYTLEAAASLGVPEVDYNGADEESISRIQATTFEGSRWSANRGYINGLRRRNLFVRKHSLVSKVIIESGRAVGVEYIRDGHTHRAFASKEVILSAGAINSPQILMLSGVGPTDHLKKLGIPVVKDLPVGRTFYEHPIFFGLIIKLNSSIVPTRLETLTNMQAWTEYFVNSSGPLTAVSWAEVIGFPEVGEESVNSSWPNFQIYGSPFPSILSPSIASALQIPDDFYQQFCVPILNQPVIEAFISPLRPRSIGTLTLRDSNVYTQPIIDPNYFAEDEDVSLTVEAIQHGIRLFTSGPFADLGAEVYDTPIPRCTNFTFGTEEYWECAVRWASISAQRACGTNKMGPQGDETAVVSPDLKVWGINGLRVVDASVMPEILPGTQMPTYMIAEKASDMIKNEHTNICNDHYCTPGRVHLPRENDRKNDHANEKEPKNDHGNEKQPKNDH